MKSCLEKCLLDINKYKRLLFAEAQSKNEIWENFGQEYVRKIKEKYGNYFCDYESALERDIAFDAINQFDDWCSSQVILL